VFCVTVASLLALGNVPVPDAAAPPAHPDGGPPLPTITAAQLAARWSAERRPGPGPARAIGTYAAGCLDGAVSLPPSGKGYEVMHLRRSRFYGHPLMVDYVKRLGAAVKDRKLGVLMVGDLSQPRGGPSPSGHRSHQSGLDADIGYAFPPAILKKRLTARDRETTGPPAVVDVAAQQFTPYWKPRVVELLRLAASDPAVDRIFVNPMIKREICAQAPPASDWVRKLRPWWLHHDHFHVRLACPPEDTDCQPQPPLAALPDDGCDQTLDWWFTEDAKTTSTKRTTEEPAAPALPAACDQLVTTVKGW
jgi:penicillin-insensitive murein endopeptidase